MKKSELRNIIREAWEEIMSPNPRVYTYWEACLIKEEVGETVGTEEEPRVETGKIPWYLLKYIQGQLVSITMKADESDIPLKFEDAIAYCLSPEDLKTLAVKHNNEKTIIKITFFETEFDRTVPEKYFIVRHDAIEEFEKNYSEGRNISAHPKYQELISHERNLSGTHHLPTIREFVAQSGNQDMNNLQNNSNTQSVTNRSDVRNSQNVQHDDAQMSPADRNALDSSQKIIGDLTAKRDNLKGQAQKLQEPVRRKLSALQAQVAAIEQKLGKETEKASRIKKKYEKPKI